jgi:hypothetical protein
MGDAIACVISSVLWMNPPKQWGVSLSDLTGLEQDSRSSVEGNEDNEKKFNPA